MLTKYWVNRDLSHLWRMHEGPLTPIDRTETVYLAAEVDALLDDPQRLAAVILKLAKEKGTP